MNENDKEHLISLVQSCISHGKFILSSGLESDYKIELEKVTRLRSELDFISKLLQALLKPEVNLLAGPIQGAITLINSLLWHLPFKVNGLFIGKDDECTGSFRIYSSQAAVTDDVLTTGKSVLRCLDLLTKLNITPLQVLIVVDRLQGGREAILHKYPDIEVQSLLTVTDLDLQSKETK